LTNVYLAVQSASFSNVKRVNNSDPLVFYKLYTRISLVCSRKSWQNHRHAGVSCVTAFLKAVYINGGSPAQYRSGKLFRIAPCSSLDDVVGSLHWRLIPDGFLPCPNLRGQSRDDVPVLS
jgi:hypothetical protein